MSTVITLDLSEIADEWQELLNELGANVPDTEGMSYGEVADATETFLREPEQVETQAQYVGLCEQLGLSPAEPDTLRWADSHQSIMLIREDTFEDYARDFAEDVYGDGVREMGTYIAWDRFADAMRTDYHSLTYDDHEWLRRA